MRKIYSFDAVLLPVTLAGCAPVPPAQDPRIDPARAAIISNGWWGGVYRGGRVTLESVDTTYPTSPAQAEFMSSPGSSVARAFISLCPPQRRFCTTLSYVAVPFEARAGHRYRIRAAETVHGRMNFWVSVEDMASGEIVGDTRTSAPQT